jgi:hypothetical protein
MAASKGAYAMSTRTFTFRSKFVRRIPDPVFHDKFGMERHFLFVPVTDVPADLPMDPNARVPNIRRSVYKDVRESLKKDDGHFHLKHKGITLVAQTVKEKSDSVFTVQLEEGQGILDGGHTYTLILEQQEDGILPANQYVKFEIITRAPLEWVPEMAGGLNTSVQVQDMSLDNLEGKFDWIKNIIREEPYASAIAWRENEDKEFDGRDIVSFLTCFNIDEFPNDVSDTQPVIAYEKKSAALKLYEEKIDSYQKLAPIVKDILRLHDMIRSEGRNYWNEEGGSFGKLAFVESRKKGFVLPFLGTRADSQLVNGALYPILAAFRWMVDRDPKNLQFRWRGGFKNVIRLWADSAVELLKMTKQASDELGRNPNAVGKSRNHWANLFARVAMRELTARIKQGKSE